MPPKLSRSKKSNTSHDEASIHNFFLDQLESFGFKEFLIALIMKFSRQDEAKATAVYKKLAAKISAHKLSPLRYGDDAKFQHLEAIGVLQKAFEELGLSNVQVVYSKDADFIATGKEIPERIIKRGNSALFQALDNNQYQLANISREEINNLLGSNYRYPEIIENQDNTALIAFVEIDRGRNDLIPVILKRDPENNFLYFDIYEGSARQNAKRTSTYALNPQTNTTQPYNANTHEILSPTAQHFRYELKKIFIRISGRPDQAFQLPPSPANTNASAASAIETPLTPQPPAEAPPIPTAEPNSSGTPSATEPFATLLPQPSSEIPPIPKSSTEPPKSSATPTPQPSANVLSRSTTTVTAEPLDDDWHQCSFYRHGFPGHALPALASMSTNFATLFLAPWSNLAKAALGPAVQASYEFIQGHRERNITHTITTSSVAAPDLESASTNQANALHAAQTLMDNAANTNIRSTTTEEPRNDYMSAGNDFISGLIGFTTSVALSTTGLPLVVAAIAQPPVQALAHHVLNNSIRRAVDNQEGNSLWQRISAFIPNLSRSRDAYTRYE